jgi:hypothetical protein
MYVDYLFALVVFSLAFRLLNVAGAAMAAVIWLPVERVSVKAGVAFEFLLQLFFCTTFAMMVSAVTLLYVHDESVEHTWLYFVTGFVFALISLSGNLTDRERRGTGAVNGAAWGALLGLVLFTLIYNWPALISWLPGLLPCLDLLFRVSNWLVSYRIVRWGISLYLAYVLMGWAMTIFSAGAFGVGGLLNFLHKRFRPSGVDSPPTQES